MENRIPTILISIACSLALIVVVLGAYTRLTQAGLGCPDWPGCYGHLIVPAKSLALAAIEQRKAWTEMIHRYAAGSLATLVMIMAIIAIIKRRQGKRFPLILPLVLIGLIIFQALLGMWTVTLQLLPVVVMGHLLGGLTILACLWWFRLTLSFQPPLQRPPAITYQALMPWVIAGVAIVFCQIALGGWVSANYAGLACVGFPWCNGALFPHLDLTAAFNLVSPIGANYQGGLLDSAARVSIQVVHRYGAIITTSYVAGLSLIILIKTQYPKLRLVAGLSLLLIFSQFTLGVLNVIKLLPLPIAVAHNAVAALTLVAMITLVFYTNKMKEKVGLLA